MQTARVLALLTLLATAGPRTAAAQAFEGSVRQRIVVLGSAEIAALTGGEIAGGARPDPEKVFAASEDELRASGATTSESSMFFKSGRIRMEMPSMPLSQDMPPELAEMMKGAYTLFDAAAKEMTTVVPAIGRAMVTTPGGLAQLSGRGDSVMTLTRPSTPAPRELGASSVAGTPTTTYEVATDESVTRVWVAPSLRSVADALRALAESMAGMLGGSEPLGLDGPNALYDKGFPMRTGVLSRLASRDAPGAGGWSYFWTEVTVDSGALPDSLFAVPSGFTVIRMGGQ